MRGGRTALLVLFSMACAACAAAAGSRSEAHPRSASTEAASSSAAIFRRIAEAPPGTTITIPDGDYPTLPLEGKQALVVEGSRGARLGGIAVTGSQDVTIRGLTITPEGSAPALVAIQEGSQRTVLDGVLIDGRDEALGASVVTDGTAVGVTLENSEITNCGLGQRCVDPSAPNTLILHNNFHDCLDCDFVRGSANGITIRGNTFERAVRGSCTGGRGACNHNDHLQIMGGGPWTIADNFFGTRDGGAASLFLNPGRGNRRTIRDVTIQSNIFDGEAGNYAIHLGDDKRGDPAATIQGVRIVNNTILSGSLSSIRVNEGWARVEPDRRPIVANNIIRLNSHGVCAGTITTRNVVEQGPACQGDLRGVPPLDPARGPLASAKLVLNHGDPAYAPATDYYGHYRNGLPDIGAIEYDGLLTPAPPVRVGSPTVITLRARTLRSQGWRLAVRVKVTSAAVLEARLLLAGREVARRKLAVAGRQFVLLGMTVPVVARKPGTLELELRATASDGRFSTRSTTVNVRP